MADASTRNRLLATAALILLVPTAGRAQTTTTPSPDVTTARAAEGAAQAGTPSTATATQPEEAKSGEIVVTGSRIARREFAAPNPIVSFNAAAIQDSGNTNITNFLERVPALTGSLDFTQTSGGNAVYARPFGAAGLNELNLRNLGTQRTLVLVDGRRHVAGEANTAAVDINSIPTDLIERVDVLTGGASAIYGADGVSGVVNFILKRDFDGFAARTQNGISSRGDAANHFFSVVGGHSFGDGRGNVTIAYEYNADDPLRNDDRRYFQEDRRQYLIPNDAAANDPSLPHNILVGNLRYGNESPVGAVFIGDEANASFNGLGQPYRPGTPAAYYTTCASCDDTPVAGYYSGDLAPRIRRHDVNLLTHYDFSDAFKLSLDGKFVQVDARTFDYFNSTYGYGIPITNPTVPDSIRAAAIAAGQDTVYVNRDDIDYGQHGEEDRRRTYRGVADVSGRISDHATYDAYYEYGRTDVRITKINEILLDRYNAALDVVRNPATGQLVCRSNLDPAAAAGAITFTPGPNSGCVPTSLFTASTPQQALNFFQVNDQDADHIVQQVASASVSGDFGQFFRLPGGPVQFSFGGEYRRESSRFDPSQNLLDNAFYTYNEPTDVLRAGGHFNVKEAFGELNAPILQGRRFAETLSVGAAYRYSSYSTIGSTTTWQFNCVYAPVRDLTFRGSYGKAVRAPNIGELFAPVDGQSNFITDPCTPQELNHGTQYRAANCTALLARYGATINPGLQSASNVLGFTSGNADLKAESARTWTAGVVLRPRWLRGFTVSVDWYDINLRNAINTPAAGQLPNLCVDQPTLNNPFCGLITRQQGTGIITSYFVEPENVASFRTAGLDLNVDYLLRTDRYGTFDFRFVGGYLHRLTMIALPGAVPEDDVDQFGRPKYNFNFSPTWTIGGFTLSYNLRWFDATRTQPKQVTDDDPDFAPKAQLRYSALWQHDIQLQYQLRNGFAFYVGATNLTDQKPDLGNAINAPISAIGRFLYAGVKLNLSRR